MKDSEKGDGSSADASSLPDDQWIGVDRSNGVDRECWVHARRRDGVVHIERALTVYSNPHGSGERKE